MYCPKCLKFNPEENLFCTHCGCKLRKATVSESSEEKQQCPHCGNEIDLSSDFCPKCGNSTSAFSHPLDKPSIILDLVAFLLPIIGFIMFLVFHHNYPKKAKSVGISALVSIISYFIFALIILIVFR